MICSCCACSFCTSLCSNRLADIIFVSKVLTAVGIAVTLSSAFDFRSNEVILLIFMKTDELTTLHQINNINVHFNQKMIFWMKSFFFSPFFVTFANKTFTMLMLMHCSLMLASMVVTAENGIQSNIGNSVWSMSGEDWQLNKSIWIHHSLKYPVAEYRVRKECVFCVTSSAFYYFVLCVEEGNQVIVLALEMFLWFRFIITYL